MLLIHFIQSVYGNFKLENRRQGGDSKVQFNYQPVSLLWFYIEAVAVCFWFSISLS